jgi:hypothetical protein
MRNSKARSHVGVLTPRFCLSGMKSLSSYRSTKPLAKARACVILMVSSDQQANSVQSGGVGAASAGVSRLTKPYVALEG